MTICRSNGNFFFFIHLQVLVRYYFPFFFALINSNTTIFHHFFPMQFSLDSIFYYVCSVHVDFILDSIAECNFSLFSSKHTILNYFLKATKKKNNLFLVLCVYFNEFIETRASMRSYLSRMAKQINA